MTTPLNALIRRLGYTFHQEELLVQALTHRSADKKTNNERLEFLGDAQLGLMVARWLFDQFPEAGEGQLTRMRAKLVREATLAEIATELNIGEHLLLGPGELKSGGRRRASILADALEAIIGAILLDGGEQVCVHTVHQWYTERLAHITPATAKKDAKTSLQEWLQGRQFVTPQYKVVASRGSAPYQEFDVECFLPDQQQSFEATGTSRRRAEQEAAKLAVAWLKEQDL
ncbi:MAG TPA: ribonuclease III [Alcanivoracaceae bacterium]|nr:ribonuclease III [Alcanivoracaceae bacterium]